MAHSQEYLDLLQDMAALHKRKNAGYNGDKVDPWSNFRACEEFGISTLDGLVARICDKYGRYQSLYKNRANDQVGEPLEETLLDLSAYVLIMICLLRESENG